jgi:flagellar biosynthetic protein FlhB
VAQSRDLSSVLLLGASFALVSSSTGGRVLEVMGALCREAWSGGLLRPETAGDFHALVLHSMLEAGRAMLPYAIALVLMAVAVHLAQTGPLLSFEIMTPRASRLSPTKGARRLVGADAWVGLLKSLLKVLIVGAITWRVLSPELGLVLGLSHGGVGDGMLVTLALLKRLAVWVLVPLLVLGVADLAWSHWRMERNMRMTRTEVRDELRQREGSPAVRGRQRAMQRELSRSRMIAAVAKADVVVVNPTHFAVALRYQREAMRAPKVVAQGRNHLARRIREVAEAHDVPIVQNAPIAQILYRTVGLEREIPESLFQAVAEILAQVFRIDPRRGATWRRAS